MRACLSFTTLLFLVLLTATNTMAKDRPLNIVVSVAPQKYLVEKIAGERANVSVMIAPGQTPATWEPSPRRMAELATTDLLFPVGVPFEKVWLPRLKSNFPHLVIADSLSGIKLRTLEDHHHHDSHDHALHADESNDPHIWLDPQRCIILANNIAQQLSHIDPAGSQHYQRGLSQLQQQLTAIDQQLHAELAPYHGQHFMVFHPSWGYFAQRYHLNQLAIETSGKEPSGAHLADLVQLARNKHVKVIFVQQQFSQKAALAIANQIDAKVVILDPLAEDLITTLLTTAQQIKAALENTWPTSSH